MPLALPATKWMIEMAMLLLRSESELILKSRRVVPQRLLDAGFSFEFPSWPEAAHDLLDRAFPNGPRPIPAALAGN